MSNLITWNLSESILNIWISTKKQIFDFLKKNSYTNACLNSFVKWNWQRHFLSYFYISSKNLKWKQQIPELFWRHDAVVITTAQLHSTKPELRFCPGSNPARSVLEIRDDEVFWQWSWLEIRLNVLRQSTMPQKQFSFWIWLFGGAKYQGGDKTEARALISNHCQISHRWCDVEKLTVPGSNDLKAKHKVLY